MHVRPRFRLVATLLAALLLAGCVDTLRAAVYEPQPPPPPLPGPPAETNLSAYDGEMILNSTPARIPTPDGEMLNATVTLNGTATTNATPAPHPVVLLVSPTYGALKQAVHPSPSLTDALRALEYMRWIDVFARRGYAVVIVDARGTGGSTGCLDFGGPLDQQDAKTAVEWVAKQPWSNGRVGMLGRGYDGMFALAAAGQQVPALQAVVVVDPVVSWYNVTASGGAKYAGRSGAEAQQTLRDGTGMPPDVPTDPFVVENYAQQLVPRPGDPRFERAADQGCAGANAAGADDPSGEANAWTKARDLTALAAKAHAPLFYTQALLDVQNRPEGMAAWFNAYAGPKHGFVWQHVPGTFGGIPSFQPDLFNTNLADPFVAGSRVSAWDMQVIRWMDHHLRDLDNNATRLYGVVDVQDSAGRWRDETAWPPLNATTQTLVLGKGGKLALLAFAANVSDDTDSWRDDPREDGGARGSRTTTLQPGAAPTRLAFRSDPLAEEVRVAGAPVVRLHASADRPNALVVARLYDVLPDGSWVLVNRGVRSLLARDGVDAPQPAVPGQTYELKVALEPDEYVFRAGHRIGLALAGDDASYVVPLTSVATTTVTYGGAAPSALLLPTVASYARVATWGAAQPGWRGPYAWGESP